MRDLIDRLRRRMRPPRFGRTAAVLAAAATVVGLDLALTWLPPRRSSASTWR